MTFSGFIKKLKNSPVDIYVINISNNDFLAFSIPKLNIKIKLLMLQDFI